MSQEYWLKFGSWDSPPQSLVDAVNSLDVHDPLELLRYGNVSSQYNQFAHTRGTDVRKVYVDWDKEPRIHNHPYTVKEMWKWMQSGEGVAPFHRPKEKLGLYDGGLEIPEQVPVACMTIALFVGSMLKICNVPVRSRWGFGNFDGDYCDHAIIEYFDDGWKKIDPRLPGREFVYSWEAAKSDSPEKFLSASRKVCGKPVISGILTRDALSLTNDSVVPWEADTFYRGTSTRLQEIEKRYSEMVDELFPLLKNPDPVKLEELRDACVVDYRNLR